MTGRRARLLMLAGLLCAIAVIAAVIASGSGGDHRRITRAVNSEHITCSYVAATTGNDRNPGTTHRPFRSIQRLADALAPGQTGCLRGGSYVGNVDLFRSGRPGRRIVLRSYPGEGARLEGALWIMASADYVTFQDMTLCGAPGGAACSGKFSSGESSAVQISGGHATFENDDVSNAGGICFILGTAPRESHREGPGDYVTIENSQIHNCGAPGQSNLIEGIYDEYSTDSVIEHNQIYDNSAMGIQFYPAAQDTRFEHNMLWTNGEGVLFGGSDSANSNDNVVAHNVIAHSVVRWNIESNWEGSVGKGNLAYDNCLYANNPLGDGYYNQAGGVEPGGAGAAGFTSRDEKVGPACGSRLHVRRGT